MLLIGIGSLRIEETARYTYRRLLKVGAHRKRAVLHEGKQHENKVTVFPLWIKSVFVKMLLIYRC